MPTTMSEGYARWRSAEETERLQAQGAVFGPDTTYLLGRAGIAPGMRVLDVGCGAGDVTFAVADLVGPTGSVIGVDQDPDVLAVARDRAARAGLSTVEFRQADLPDVSLDGPVDAVVGRFVLLHLHDPVVTVRALRRHVRPGGVVTFQEIALSPARTVPPVASVDLLCRLLAAAMRAGGSSVDMGDRLHDIFRQAGFDAPELAGCQRASGGERPEIFDYAAATLTTVAPVLESHDLATREEIDLVTSAERLRSDVLAESAVFHLGVLVGAWALA